MAKKPHLYVIAGPNGAGKTTFAKRYLRNYRHCYEFLNADLIASGFYPLKSEEEAAVAAGRRLLENISKFAKKKIDFGFESTLSGKSYAKFFQRIRKSGYHVHIYYLWIPTAKLALERIRERVANGGHNVPSDVVVRRFKKSLKNLFSLYWDKVDAITILDNSRRGASRFIAAHRNKKLRVGNPALFDRIIEEAKK